MTFGCSRLFWRHCQPSCGSAHFVWKTIEKFTTISPLRHAAKRRHISFDYSDIWWMEFFRLDFFFSKSIKWSSLESFCLNLQQISEIWQIDGRTVFVIRRGNNLDKQLVSWLRLVHNYHAALSLSLSPPASSPPPPSFSIHLVFYII